MILSIWKPSGPSSHSIIYQVRKITGEKRVGHAGTLDPLAAGVLIIGIGRQSTKQLSHFVQQDKEYRAVFYLGQISKTDDAEGEKTIIDDKKQPTIEEIQAVLKEFIGTIQQIPPVFSAIKLKGKKSYELARKGQAVELTARPVKIYNITLEKYAYPQLELTIHCGKGTYIRSLARDIGKELETGAYMAELTRTRVGEFNKNNSLTIGEFEKKWNFNSF